MADPSEAVVMTAQPGAVIVVTAPRMLTHEEAHSIQTRTKLLFPDNPVLVVADGMKIEQRPREAVLAMLGYRKAECRFCGLEPHETDGEPDCGPGRHYHLWSGPDE